DCIGSTRERGDIFDGLHDCQQRAGMQTDAARRRSNRREGEEGLSMRFVALLFAVMTFSLAPAAARADSRFECGVEHELGRIAAHAAVSVGGGLLTQLFYGPPAPPVYAPVPVPVSVYAVPAYPYPVYVHPHPAPHYYAPRPSHWSWDRHAPRW